MIDQKFSGTICISCCLPGNEVGYLEKIKYFPSFVLQPSLVLTLKGSFLSSLSKFYWLKKPKSIYVENRCYLSSRMKDNNSDVLFSSEKTFVIIDYFCTS